jgi:hypothetical protein
LIIPSPDLHHDLSCILYPSTTGPSAVVSVLYPPHLHILHDYKPPLTVISRPKANHGTQRDVGLEGEKGKATLRAVDLSTTDLYGLRVVEGKARAKKRRKRKSEHSKNSSPSNKEKHEVAQTLRSFRHSKISKLRHLQRKLNDQSSKNIDIDPVLRRSISRVTEKHLRGGDRAVRGEGG